MVSRRRCAGFSVLEATIALAVIGTVAAATMWSVPQQIKATGTAFRTAAARRVARSVLETTIQSDLVAGEHAVDLVESSPLDAADVVRNVRAVDAGLWEIEAVVRWREPGEDTARESRLVTWIAGDQP